MSRPFTPCFEKAVLERNPHDGFARDPRCRVDAALRRRDRDVTERNRKNGEENMAAARLAATDHRPGLFRFLLADRLHGQETML